MTQPVFRFAPSPNGLLHLGHALSALLNFDELNQIPISMDLRGEAPFSVDANLLLVSSEG